MPLAQQSSLLRALLIATLSGALLASCTSSLVIWFVAGREELRDHARWQVLKRAQELAAHVGVSVGRGGSISVDQEQAASLRDQLALMAGVQAGRDVAFQVMVREDGASGFRLLAGSGPVEGDMGAAAGEVLRLARLGEASFRIGPRIPPGRGTLGEIRSEHMVVAAAGYRGSPESGVSVLALVRAPVWEAAGRGSVMGWGMAAAVGLSLAMAAGMGMLSWGSVRQMLLATEIGLKRVLTGQGDYRLSIARADELGRIQERVNELAASWQRTRHEAAQLRVQLSEAAKRVSVAEEAKSDFLANMSHEVRTPMNGILGTLSLIDDGDMKPEQRKLLQIVRTSGDRLLRMINDILDFDRLLSARLVLDRKRVNLEELTVDVARTFAPAAAEKGVELLVFLDPRLPVYIEGDEVRLRQVLDNLVENAVKFTSRGEVQVEVQAGLRETGRRIISFVVRDTGMGISADKQEQLFKAFSQQDTSTTRAYGGSGLGLAIAKKLSELHEGRLTVESEEGRGTMVSFEIPLRQWRGPVSEDEEERIPVGKRVGVVMANRKAGIIVERYLRELGMAPVLPGAAGRGECWQELQAIVWDVDGTAPEMLREMQQANARGIPVLALHGPAMLVPAGFGSAKEIQKPFGPTELRRALGRAIHPEAETEEPVECPGHFAAKYPARILVVEDQPMNQKIVQMMLQKLGYEVRIASNGREGVDVVGENATDLVFMDLQMPVLGGIDATREIRRNFDLRRQPVIIAMTGYALSGVRESCLEAGMNDFLTKPLSVDDLRDAIERSCPLMQAAA